MTETKKPTTPRKCLNCRRTFESDGPYNKMCDRCRAYGNAESPFDPAPGGLPEYFLVGGN